MATVFYNYLKITGAGNNHYYRGEILTYLRDHVIIDDVWYNDDNDIIDVRFDSRHSPSVEAVQCISKDYPFLQFRIGVSDTYILSSLEFINGKCVLEEIEICDEEPDYQWRGVKDPYDHEELVDFWSIVLKAKNGLPVVDDIVEHIRSEGLTEEAVLVCTEAPTWRTELLDNECLIKWESKRSVRDLIAILGKAFPQVVFEDIDSMAYQRFSAEEWRAQLAERALSSKDEKIAFQDDDFIKQLLEMN